MQQASQQEDRLQEATSEQTEKAYKDAIFDKIRLDLAPEVCVFS